MSIDACILRALFARDGDYVSGSLLAEQLGVSRAAVWKHIEQLQAAGYEIEAQPHYGYRLGNLGDVLCADEILARLPEARAGGIAWKPVIFRETSSTMDLAGREAQLGHPEGLVVVAEQQTTGRGRRGRAWESRPEAGLYLSLLLRPDWPLRELTRLTVLTSLAVAEAVENLIGHTARIKWPNDIFIKDRKLSGILTEVQCEPERIRHAVVGIGLNVNHTARDFSPEVRPIATSLKLETGQEWRRADVLLAILERIGDLWFQPFATVRESWSSRCFSLGQVIRVHTTGGERSGQAIGLDESGALLLRDGTGQVERVTAGDLV